MQPTSGFAGKPPGYPPAWPSEPPAGPLDRVADLLAAGDPDVGDHHTQVALVEALLAAERVIRRVHRG